MTIKSIKTRLKFLFYIQFKSNTKYKNKHKHYNKNCSFNFKNTKFWNNSISVFRRLFVKMCPEILNILSTQGIVFYDTSKIIKDFHKF